MIGSSKELSCVFQSGRYRENYFGKINKFGIDITRDKIPVRPGAHYMIGGVTIDSDRRTLWVTTEAAPLMRGFRKEDEGRSLVLEYGLDDALEGGAALGKADIAYGAVILSFLGGIRWGSAVATGNGRPTGLGFSVLPSLWAVFLLWWADPSTAAWGMFAGFVLLGLADGFFVVPGLPSWMQRLRLRLTAAVAACHLPVLAMLLFT